MSWYREPLNTATRGGRREFPAVAVIVAEANKVTIYDGDDPALPMWMVFGPRTGDGFMAGSTLTGSAEFSPYMHFFDGKMALSTSLGADIADFIADELIRHPISGEVGGVENGILNRSATAAASGDVTALGTPERVLGVGLVAARNAPICPKSKLPTPHIFVGG